MASIKEFYFNRVQSNDVMKCSSTSVDGCVRLKRVTPPRQASMCYIIILVPVLKGV